MEAWLTGKSNAEEQLPNYGEIKIKSAGQKVTAYVQRYSLKDKETEVIETNFSAETNSFQNFKFETSNNYFPTDWEYVRTESEVASIFWFLPKLKEWALKFNGLNGNDAPDQFIKEI